MLWDAEYALRAELVLGCVYGVVGMVSEGFMGPGVSGMSWQDYSKQIYSDSFDQSGATLYVGWSPSLPALASACA